MALTLAPGSALRGPAQPVVHRGRELRELRGFSEPETFQERPSSHAARAAGALVLGAGFCRSQARNKGHRSRLRAEGEAKEAKEAPSSVAEKDRLVRYMGGNVSVRAITATEMVQKVTSMHGCSPMVSIALGRALMATALMANGRDEGESLQLRIQGDGPIGSIITEASSALDCRGMVGQPTADAASVPELVGVGAASTLRLTRTHPFWKRPYTGTIPLRCGEIAEDVVQYLAMSEQTPASMGLSVEWDKEAGCVKAAEGWLVTLLPGWEDTEVAVVETNIKTFESIQPSSSRPDAICQHMMRELRGEYQAEQLPNFRCKCSKSRLATAVMMLGKAEVQQILEAKEIVDAKCDWCGNALTLTAEEVLAHMTTAGGQEEISSRSYSPRQLKLKEEELKAMPATGRADWS